MNILRKLLFILFVLLVIACLIFVYARLSMIRSVDIGSTTAILTTTILTLGTLLAIITAGLMFTQGKFSELVSELNNKSPDYLAKVFTLEKIQAIGTQVLALRHEFNHLAATTTVTEEKKLYEKVVAKTSAMFVGCAVLMHLKMKQQRIPPTDIFVSEMDSNLYTVYQKKRQSIKKDWQLLVLVKQILDLWEGSAAIVVEKSRSQTPLEDDIRNSVAILKLKETVDKSSNTMSSKIMKISDSLGTEVDKISKKLHEDRVPQLLSQMKQVNAVRGTYFHLTVIFIAVPLLIGLLVLPQLHLVTTSFLEPIVAITNVLSIIGVVFLLLYVYKILNV